MQIAQIFIKEEMVPGTLEVHAGTSIFKMCLNSFLNEVKFFMVHVPKSYICARLYGPFLEAKIIFKM